MCGKISILEVDILYVLLARVYPLTRPLDASVLWNGVMVPRWCYPQLVVLDRCHTDSVSIAWSMRYFEIGTIWHCMQ